MFSGVLVGGVMGYYFDQWFASKPLFFIIFVFLGIAAAILNIYKLASKEAVEAENAQDDASSPE